VAPHTRAAADAVFLSLTPPSPLRNQADAAAVLLFFFSSETASTTAIGNRLSSPI
jgi:hypothetical protein